PGRPCPACPRGPAGRLGLRRGRGGFAGLRLLLLAGLLAPGRVLFGGSFLVVLVLAAVREADLAALRAAVDDHDVGPLPGGPANRRRVLRLLLLCLLLLLLLLLLLRLVLLGLFLRPVIDLGRDGVVRACRACTGGAFRLLGP